MTDQEFPQLPDAQRTKPRKILLGTIWGAAFVILLVLYHVLFAAPEFRAAPAQFVIPLSSSADLGAQLKSAGFVRKSSVFDRLSDFSFGKIAPGGYELSKSMNVFQILSTLRRPPEEVWVVIPPGLRKEEIAELLGEKLGWSPAQVNEWDTTDTSADPDYFEGVYFPDTYLIPRSDTPADVAKRLIAEFEEKFAPYAKQAAAKNIQWTTVLKVASLIQREAAGTNDMSIISGVIWNRLAQNMRLQIDATVQYARGNTGSGWWGPVTHADLSIDSPYNTYLHAGLPPHPIANPGLDAINAALNPAATTCLYYIHDAEKNIHCATTNAEQAANVAEYLR